MVEMERTGPGSARVLDGGAAAGEARWAMEPLAWPGERVQVARVARLDCPEGLRADFWAYLCFLFQGDGAAAAELDGVWFWFSQALERSWRAWEEGRG